MSDLSQQIAALSPEKRKLLLQQLNQKKGNVFSRTQINPQSRQSNSFPLSFAQQRLWFLHQLEPSNPFYNIPMAVCLSGRLNCKALQQSLNQIIRRHEILRTNFIIQEGQPVQLIRDSLTFIVSVIDLQELTVTLQETTSQQLATQEALRPFDLANEPLLRAKLFKLSKAEHILLLTMHHIIFDGWSMDILMRELATAYQAFCNNLPLPLPELPIQYADFAVWQRHWLQAEVLQTQLSYWQQQLVNLPVLQLPTDRPRPSVQTFRGGRQFLKLPRSLSDALKTLCQQERVTLFMLLLTAFQILLSRYTAQQDIVVGCPIGNRNQTETEGLIGFFINTVVLRTDLSGNPSFRVLLERVRKVALGAYANQDLPFERLVEEIQPERDLSQNPLFQVTFSLQKASMKLLASSDLTLSPLEFESGTTRFDLELHLREYTEGLEGCLVYSTDLFDAATIARMLGHFQVLLFGIVANPEQRFSELPLLTAAEQQQLVEWNNTNVEYPQNKCLHQLFEAQVEKTPDAVALVFEDIETLPATSVQITYQELNYHANKIAHHLQLLGVGPEVLVGICIEHSPLMFIGMLGILKAGGAYVPLDPSYPQERLAFILNDTQVPVLLTRKQLLEKLPAHSAQVVCLDMEAETVAQRSQENPVTEVTAAQLAYVIYTSGSTGKPKGVLVSHANVVRLFAATQSWYDFNAQDVWTLFHSIAFDFSVWELWGSLLYGGRLVIVPYLVSRDPKSFYNLLCQEQVTILNQTPSAFRQLMKAEESLETTENLNLRVVIFGGEALELQSLKPWLKRHGDKLPRLVNMYGITETTVHVTYRPLSMTDMNGTASVIGRPIPDLQVYLLDQNLQPVPFGVPGEIYLGGAGLARGYLNRPDLTAERFIPNPNQDARGTRLYKTGDKACYLPNGDIAFLGRIDHQVKIRGFRIELGEIEVVLGQHPEILQSVVIVREDVPGDKRLIAYLVVKQQPAPTINDLRHFLKKKLPEYMIPSGFVMLNTLPLTANGKIDHRALPKPETSSFTPENSFVSARDTWEHQLSYIWSDILDIHPVGVTDNFFDLGGNSLLAVRLMAQIQQQFGKNLPLATLFGSPTIEHLATMLRQHSNLLPSSPLVAIQPHGSKQPFFCVPGAGGNTIYFHDLAHHLGSEQPFYGLQPLGLDGESPPHTRVEDMAAYYIQAIQTIQPQGPYFLGGHSFGGKVAFEMAQQLQKKGHKVALLAILDTTAPIPGGNPINVDWDDARWLTEIAGITERLFGKKLEVLPEVLQNITPDEQLNYFKERLQTINVLPPKAGITQIRGLVQVFKANSQTHYVPNEVYLTPIAFFRASEVNLEAAAAISDKHYEILLNPTYGWSEFSTKPIKIYSIPGDHISMMAKPHVQVLAEHLKICLEQIQADAPVIDASNKGCFHQGDKIA